MLVAESYEDMDADLRGGSLKVLVSGLRLRNMAPQFGKRIEVRRRSDGEHLLLLVDPDDDSFTYGMTTLRGAA